MNLTKIISTAGCFSLIAIVAQAAENNEVQQSEWRANFRRVALDISSTSVGNAEEYKNSPSSKLSADGEEVIKGVLDFVLEHETQSSRWDNGIYAEDECIDNIYPDMIFSICKAIDTMAYKEIEQRHSQSIVDSKERIKEYKKEHGMRMC